MFLPHNNVFQVTIFSYLHEIIRTYSFISSNRNITNICVSLFRWFFAVRLNRTVTILKGFRGDQGMTSPAPDAFINAGIMESCDLQNV